MIIEPKDYEKKSNESAYTFKNAYVNYARFHADEVQVFYFIQYLIFMGFQKYVDSHCFYTNNHDYTNGYELHVQHGAQRF